MKDVVAEREDSWVSQRPLAGLTASLPIKTAPGKAEEPVAYELLDFPFSPSFLNDPNDEATARSLVDWLRGREPTRASYVVGVLGSLGAPVTSLPGDPTSLEDLSLWFCEWLPYAFRKDKPPLPWPVAKEAIEARLANRPAPRIVPLEGDWPTALGYQRSSGLTYSAEDFVTYSMAYDLAMLVVSCARRARPDLEWLPCPKPPGLRLRPTERWRWDPIFNPLEPGWSPTMRALGFVVSPKSRPEDRARNDLYRIYERQVGTHPTWVGLPDSPPEPLPVDNYFADLTRLADAASDSPPPSPQVLEAVAAFRRAGWFQREKNRSDADLAMVLNAACVAFWGWGLDERLAKADDLDERLICLDGARTIFLDSDAGVRPGYMAYRAVLSVLAELSGGAYVVSRVEEDWDSDPARVTVSFWLNGTKCSFSLLDMGRFLNPAFVTELNGLLPASGPRYWFVDNGGSTCPITRATDQERRALEAVRPVVLLPEAPTWWRDVAS